MLPEGSKFDAKFFFMVINRKTFLVVHPLCEPPGNLCLKCPLLVELINKW